MLKNFYIDFLDDTKFDIGTKLYTIKQTALHKLSQEPDIAKPYVRQVARLIMADYDVLADTVGKHYELDGCTCNISNMKIKGVKNNG